jgi:outer membrane protein OmpA-like peptidoglycan-associated protein
MRKFGHYTSIFGLTIAITAVASAETKEAPKEGATATAVAVEASTSDKTSTAAPQPKSTEGWDKDRGYSQFRFNSLRGGTGLVHLLSADSGAPGTFRISFLSSNYSGSGFLCPNLKACTAPTGISDTQDSASRTGADLAISATLAPFLEANVGTHSHGFSDNFGKPSVIQVLGDSYLGLKGFTPRQADRIFSAGGFANLNFLNSAGEIGIKTANITFAALGTLDLSNRTEAAKRVPLRFHGNFGYLFDNSAEIAGHIESVRKHPITRIERQGFGINRIDSFILGIGGEYVGKYLQPFVEWTADIASNRQGYKCIARYSYRGDICLARASGMSGTPSRLTLGTRITPKFYGLSGVAAFDIGTSSTSTFVEERVAELPWNFYLGLAYAIDTVPPKPIVTQAPIPPKVTELPPEEHHLLGVVLDEESSQPITHATVEFDDASHNGLITKADGSFVSSNVKPGSYKLRVSADGYKDGTCEVTVADTSGEDKPKAQTAGQAPTPPQALSSRDVEVTCKLKVSPALGVLFGNLVDSETSAAIAQASIKVRDERDRVLELQSNGDGDFRVENVPAGHVHLLVTANGYLPLALDMDIQKKVEQHSTLVLRKIPAKPNAKVTPQEIKITAPIGFVASSPELTRDSMPLVQEVASVLLSHSELARVEIQVYTDEDGSVNYNKRLSEQRAGTLRVALTSLGVDANRLTATGMGSEKPVVPNAKTEADHAKNRRVRFVIPKL